MFHKSCVPFPNMQDTLQSLTECNFRLGLITNGYTEMQRASIEALDIERFFDLIFISEQIGLRKPDPQIFWRALQKIEAEPGESIYVGDHPINDIVAARSAGMLGVWKSSGHWTNEIEADYKINDLSEILSLPILTE